ncbi:hypothetical protein EEB13_05610 [Rhodococcus sp. WS3]|uniref:LtfC-like domain-containing protein n=1 Tax=Rhodococcus sp. WS3 TaxID=2486271 RepID=UPI00114454C9|nr:hypothetical protein [Rhodococcus sp. WS3]ROZ49399.1 hypothetical protein EEB13_05610 [Rhodococcus sp. WS3]
MSIGWIPIYDDIALTRGDLIFTRKRDEGPIPPGTVIEIIWESGENWGGEISGDTVTWRIQSTEVATIADGTPFVIWVRYQNDNTETTDDYEWISGRARRSARQ